MSQNEGVDAASGPPARGDREKEPRLSATVMDDESMSPAADNAEPGRRSEGARAWPAGQRDATTRRRPYSRRAVRGPTIALRPPGPAQAPDPDVAGRRASCSERSSPPVWSGSVVAVILGLGLAAALLRRMGRMRDATRDMTETACARPRERSDAGRDRRTVTSVRGDGRRAAPPGRGPANVRRDRLALAAHPVPRLQGTLELRGDVSRHRARLDAPRQVAKRARQPSGCPRWRSTDRPYALDAGTCRCARSRSARRGRPALRAELAVRATSAGSSYASCAPARLGARRRAPRPACCGS